MADCRIREDARSVRPRTVPRKQRTRQHVIADQSVNYVERFIIDDGHTTHRLEKDYGYDLLLFTYDEHGYVEPGLAFLQLKAATTLKESGSAFVFDLDVRDYHLWVRENYPVFLILFDAARRRGYWVHVQTYFSSDLSRRPKRGAKSVRVRAPKRQTISRRAIGQMRDIKRAVILTVKRERRDD
jgi:hypothetical protein